MSNAKKNALPKGEKSQYVREALQSLGLDANYGDTAQWIKDKYGADISDPTFYHTRKEMVQEQTSGGTPPAPAPAPRKDQPTKQAPAGKGKSASAGAEAVPNGPPPQEGVAEMVTMAKALIQRLGKDEVKRLIDAL